MSWPILYCVTYRATSTRTCDIHNVLQHLTVKSHLPLLPTWSHQQNLNQLEEIPLCAIGTDHSSEPDDTYLCQKACSNQDLFHWKRHSIMMMSSNICLCLRNTCQVDRTRFLQKMAKKTQE